MTGGEWQGTRVLVTGHTGFKGSWLCSWLLALGADVAGFSIGAPEPRSMFETIGIADSLALDGRGDVRSLGNLAAALDDARPEVVFHLAAQPLVRASYDAPVETFEINALGTLNLLEAVRRSESVRAVVVVTTDKCYANREWVWGYREHEALGGEDPYSASKACAELVVGAYRSSFFGGAASARIASARAGNVIGGGDYSRDRLLPDAIAALREGRPLDVRNPDAVRPWQHVLAPLHGYIVLAESLLRGDDVATAWNFGPAAEDALPVRSVVDLLMAHAGPEAPGWRTTPADDGKHEAGLLRLDSSLAASQLQWHPAWDAREGVRRTLDWYRAEDEGEDMLAFTRNQIRDYEEAAG